MSLGWRDVAAWLLKVGLGAVLLSAAWAKLAAPDTFAEEITNYRFLPELAPFLAPSLPGLELLLGVLLVVALPRSRWLHAAALVGAGLMVVFTIAVVQVVVRGINVECGCFGGGGGPVTWLTVGRDVGLFLGFALLLGLVHRPAAAASMAAPAAALS